MKSNKFTTCIHSSKALAKANYINLHNRAIFKISDVMGFEPPFAVMLLGCNLLHLALLSRKSPTECFFNECFNLDLLLVCACGSVSFICSFFLC